MNDFTKEELYNLRYAIEKLRQPALKELGFYDLKEKLQSMIHNYCEPCPLSEHEFYDRLVCETCGLVEGF